MNRDKQADSTLLSNLRYIRRKLIDDGMPRETCHQLLARVMFVQFLCDRRDSTDTAALSRAEFDRLRRVRHRGEPVLLSSYMHFHEILRSHRDTYSLFRHLDACFNGDLFPGKEPSSDRHRRTRAEIEKAWVDEMAIVTGERLGQLADFVEGKEDTKAKQRLLWQHYSFDTIPLEFISSIYEEFLAEDQEKKPQESARRLGGAYYTPAHLVDFILDEVLPWDGDRWNLRVLDPACGSGIFLVKAFQRLAHRWRKLNGRSTLTPKVARRLLEKNLLGVDNDEKAVRVASFSLYLAMLDELDPREYWHIKGKLPALRHRRIIREDFFSEKHPAFASGTRQKYHIIAGNAPWGDKVRIGQDATSWADGHQWRIPDKNLGPLFLPKVAMLLHKNGKAALLQPAMALLLNRSKTASAFRQRLFRELPVVRIVKGLM